MSYIEEIDKIIEEYDDCGNTHWYFNFNELNLKGVPYLSELLKDVEIRSLVLIGLDVESVKHITEALDRNILLEDLRIDESDIGDEGARYVADLLKNSEIAKISLTQDNIGDDGAKYLAEQLKESNVFEIILGDNKIGDEGLRALADLWGDGQVKKLHLFRNKITTRSSETISELFELANKRYIWLHVHDPADESKQIDVWQDKQKYPTITIRNQSFSDGIAEFVNKTFGEIILNFDYVECLRDDEVEHLKKAIQGVTIRELRINFFDSSANLFKHIPEIFGNHHVHKIGFLNLPDVSYFMGFLKSNVSHFQINHVDKMDKLVDILKSSNIRYLSILDSSSLSANYCIKTLACAIKHTKIVNLDLGQSFVRMTNLCFLADELKNTQVTRLKLHATFDEETANYFAGVIEESQLVSVEFTGNNHPDAPTERYLAAVSNNKKTAGEICSAFDNLVTLDLKNNKLEFMLPKDSGPLDQYVNFIEILHENPNVRAHIIYDRLEIATKIDAFVDNLQDHFNSFINSNIQGLVEKYENSNFVEFVKKFDSANLGYIVQNLLLHRHLYFLDEKAEILHPFIYKMLQKYELPLFNENMEPNKKSDIIKYYEGHPEIQGVQELLEMLK